MTSRENPFSGPTAPTPAVAKGGFVCPNCECSAFTRVKPQAGFAFAKDFKCIECGEQVPAPIPIWGRVSMVGFGSALALLGVFWVYANATRGNMTGSAIGCVILFMGAKSAIAGCRPN